MAGPVPQEKSEQGFKATSGESGREAILGASINALQPAGNQAYMGTRPDRSAKPNLNSTYAAMPLTGNTAVAEFPESPTRSTETDVLMLLPLDQSVRLLESISVGELAEELYGESNLWRSRLLPLNRWMLEGATVDTQLLVGSTLRIIPDLLVEPQRTIVLSVLRLQRSAREYGDLPYIEARPDTVLVPGNAARYEVNWPGNWFMSEDYKTRIEWWAESDKEAVKRFPLVPERVNGPTGLIDEARTWTVAVAAPGRHLIHCRLTSPSGERHEVTYEQYVATLPEKTKIAVAMHPEVTSFPAFIAEERKTDSEDWDLIAKEDRETFDKRLDALNTLEAASRDTDLIVVRAVYVSSSEEPMTLPLKIFMGYDPDKKNKVDTTFYLKLWDFTYGDGKRTQVAEGMQIDATVRKLLREFADDVPYPKGNISFEVEGGELRGHGSWIGYSTKLEAQSLTYPTDGGTKGAAVLRGLGFAALAVGGIAALAGQAEIAVPALWVSGALAAAGATVSLKDRLEHGDFEWNVETSMDLLDIAGALLSFGLSSKVTATIRGLGSVTITDQLLARGIGRVQLGIMGAQHLAHIDGALATGDQKQVAGALRAALTDGALILIMHRATRRLSGQKKPGPESKGTLEQRKEGEPASPREDALKTMAGAGGDAPPKKKAAVSGTRDQIAEQLQVAMQDEVQQRLAPRKAPVTPPELAAGRRAPKIIPPDKGSATVGDPHPTLESARKAYDQVIAETRGQREVGIWQNKETGEFVVRIGQPTEVGIYEPERWRAVQHYHTNLSDMPLWRGPARADVSELGHRVAGEGHTMTEIVEFPLPKGEIGRVAYTVTAEGKVIVERFDSTGRRPPEVFSSIDEYHRQYESKKIGLNDQVKADVDRWLEGRRGHIQGDEPAGGEKTNFGAPPKLPSDQSAPTKTAKSKASIEDEPPAPKSKEQKKPAAPQSPTPPVPTRGAKTMEAQYIDALKKRYPKLRALDIRPKHRQTASRSEGAPESAFEERMRTTQGEYSLQVYGDIQESVINRQTGKPQLKLKPTQPIIEFDGISADGYIQEIKLGGTVDEIVTQLRRQADFAEAYGLKGVEYSLVDPGVAVKVEAAVASERLRNVWRVRGD